MCFVDCDDNGTVSLLGALLNGNSVVIGKIKLTGNLVTDAAAAYQLFIDAKKNRIDGDIKKDAELRLVGVVDYNCDGRYRMVGPEHARANGLIPMSELWVLPGLSNDGGPMGEQS